MIQVAPSILSADFSRLEVEIRDVEAAGADLLHLDVMDGHFVPNITFGPPVVKSVDRCTELILDTHLMIDDPLDYAEAFARAGADWISFHVEAVRDPERVIDRLEELGVRPAVAISPDTGLYRVRPLLPRLPMILVMTVFPGFGGQSFIPEVLPKIRELRELGFMGDIEVDGGVDAQTAPRVVEAGATILVAGSAVFGKPDRRTAIEAIRGAAERSAPTARG